MQFYLDGHYTGDPAVVPLAPGSAAAASDLPAEVDVLIVGSGPAGLVLAAQLARFPGITTRIVERRAGPLRIGQADGIACRTVEMFEAFGLGETLLKEAYWVNETSFWRPDPADRSRIVRTGRIQDVEDGLSASPHVIVNQARIHDYLLDSMRRSATRLAPDYGLEFVDLVVEDSGAYPVRVTLRRSEGEAAGANVSVRARYVVGCDGARSGVRRAIGRELRGDVANHAWGVMDILAVTDFPDIRLKAAIQSSAGSIILIPREGGYLVRLYVDLGEVTADNRAAVRAMTAGEVVAAANRVLHPYRIEVRETAWFSIYEVAQRLADAFDDVPAEQAGERLPRVFIAGDACHTHSAKAGQGMNVSMQDAFNLGWKLAAVLLGRCAPSLLATYSAERQPIAAELIAFDREWSAMLGAPAKDPAFPERGGVDPQEVQAYFVRHGRYTAGVATRYRPALLTGEGTHQALATGFSIGTRFHSAPVVRVADARAMQLGHAAQADGRWRVYAFADRDGAGLRAWCEWAASAPDSPLRRHTPAGADIDAVIDVRGIFQQPHREIAVERLPALLLPRKGRLGLIDYEKAYAPELKNGPDVFDLRGIDRARGAIVVVRPDQYVAHVLPLDDHAGLAAFFAAFLLDRTSSS